MCVCVGGGVFLFFFFFFLFFFSSGTHTHKPHQNPPSPPLKDPPLRLRRRRYGPAGRRQRQGRHEGPVLLPRPRDAAGPGGEQPRGGGRPPLWGGRRLVRGGVGCAANTHSPPQIHIPTQTKFQPPTPPNKNNSWSFGVAAYLMGCKDALLAADPHASPWQMPTDLSGPRHGQPRLVHVARRKGGS